MSSSLSVGVASLCFASLLDCAAPVISLERPVIIPMHPLEARFTLHKRKDDADDADDSNTALYIG